MILEDKEQGLAEIERKLADNSLAAMPFRMTYETAYCKREHYEDIVAVFRNHSHFSERELVYLIEVIVRTSQEIYESYSELCSIFRKSIKEYLEDETVIADKKSFVYALLLGCTSDVLLKEKYVEMIEMMLGTMSLNEEIVVSEGLQSDRNEWDCGIDLMILSQEKCLEQQIKAGL